jgi:hypothetical protein
MQGEVEKLQGKQVMVVLVRMTSETNNDSHNCGRGCCYTISVDSFNIIGLHDGLILLPLLE